MTTSLLLSTSELSGRYSGERQRSVYYKAFGKRWLSVAIELAMMLRRGGLRRRAGAGVRRLSPARSSWVPTGVASVGLLVAIGALAIKGMSRSAKTAALFTATSR